MRLPSITASDVYFPRPELVSLSWSTAMPSFFAPGLRGLPPTPPDMLEPEQSFYMFGPRAFPPRYSQTGCEFIEQYSQSTCYGKPAPMNLHAQPVQPQPLQTSRDRCASAHPVFPQQGVNRSMYGPPLAPTATARVLPPIRNSVQLPPMESSVMLPQQCRRQDAIPQLGQQRPHNHQKAEKTTGGVSAHLDYDMDQMSDFVAELAHGMYDLYRTKINLADIDFARSVYPGMTVSPQFRKYVFQILSATRLPSSTILLSMFYLASRMRMLSLSGVYTSDSGQVYRMLTCALILGSKFLDDNTFQNKSWAEVSNISVAELNAMELDWLFAFQWKIHDRIYEDQDGFATWWTQWEAYKAKATVKAHGSSRQRLAPIDTNAANMSRTVSKPLLSPEGPIPPQYQRSARYENSWLNPAASEYSPPSAPQSGPSTPDYYSLGSWGYANPAPSYPLPWTALPQQQQQQQQIYVPRSAPRPQFPPYNHTPSYALPFAQNVWACHGSPCGCLYCTKQYEHYMCGNSFSAVPTIVAA